MRGHRSRYILAVLAWILCALIVAPSTSASSLRLVSGGRAFPEEFAPVLAGDGFVVPAEVAELFGAELHATQTGVELSYQGRHIAFRFEEAPHATLLGERVYVPLRTLADFLHLRVSWDIASNTMDLGRWTLLGSTIADDGETELAPRASTALAGGRPTAGFSGIGGSLGLTAPSLVGGGRTGIGGEQRSDEAAGAPSLFPKVEAPRLTWTALQQATGLLVERLPSADRLAYSLKAPGEISVKTAHIIEPDRLVVDVVGVDGAELEPWLQESQPVTRVRASSFEGHLRLVFDLSAGVGHRIVESGEGEVVLLFFRPLSVIEVEAEAGGGRIKLDLPGETPYQVTRLTDPDRVVIDLAETTLIGGAREIVPESGPVWRVRAAQFQPETARIVLDVADATEVEPVMGESLSLYYGDRAGVAAYRPVGERELHIGIKGERDLSVVYLRNPDRVVIDVPGMRLAEPVPDVLLLEGPVHRIRMSQFTRDVVRIVADLRYRVQFATFSEGGRSVVALRQPLLSGKSIAVDAGHGGRDVGAISPVYGLVEKDVNLAVTRRLAELLSGAEATVVLTREGDAYPDLWERARVANEQKSDVFVSVHHNSGISVSETAKGTETYFKAGSVASKALGVAVQSAVVSALGSIDRGVRPSPGYVVLKEAEVPAVLVEVAFLSDPEEEELIKEAWFRDRAAEGIFNGLLKYFHPSDRFEWSPSQANGRKAGWRSLQAAEAAGGNAG